MTAADKPQDTQLGRVVVAGGGAVPFYSAILRAFGHKGDWTHQVVDDAFALRGLLLDADTQVVTGTKDEVTTSYDLHTPTILRLHARPLDTKFSSSRTVELATPAGRVSGDIVESEAASDLLVTPLTVWPDSPDEQATLPAWRVVQGAYGIKLKLTGAFAKLLDYKAAAKTLFGGFLLDAASPLPVTLTPDGLEFVGSLPDPTYPFGGKSGDRIRGVFRLECERTDEDFDYRLRLVRAAGNQPEIDDLEERIARAFGRLGSFDAPVAVRYDKRPLAPPISFPLQYHPKSGAKPARLGLVGAGSFDMHIEHDAIDVRVRSVGHFPESESGLAVLFARTVTWRTKAGNVEVQVIAGAVDAGTSIDLAFVRQGKTWPGSVTGFGDRAVYAPLGPFAERLLTLYRDAKALGPDVTQAPYLYLPLDRGWLQLAIPSPSDKGSKGVVGSAISAMSGRVYGAQATPLKPCLTLDDATGIDLRIAWQAMDPTSVSLKAVEPKGQLLGLLFAAETSPTASEALPTLRGGPAATRDLPLWFGATPQPPYLEGDVRWIPGGLFTATLKTAAIAARGPVPDTKSEMPAPDAIAWLPFGNSPFVTNFPLTRSQPAPKPSFSRDLLPRTITGGAVTLTYDTSEVQLPSLSAPQQWMHPYERPARGFRDDTLVLTTLAGVEFVPAKTPADADLDAALRFDLPILDELFAWSDPPKKAAPVGLSQTPPPAHFPTSLEPAKLMDVWVASRRRMRLTRTQGAHATGWLPADKAAKIVDIGGLLETYSWAPAVAFKTGGTSPYGSYQLGAETYAGDKAAEGLGGQGVAKFQFDVNLASAILPGGDDFEVAGFAANLYLRDKLHWDSRGFGMSAALDANGIRAARVRRKNGNVFQPKDLGLLTMKAPESIDLSKRAKPNDWCFAKHLRFFVRDLAIVKSEFDGLNNPVEGRRGTEGHAFNQGDFAESLHEWRLFEMPEHGKPRAHDIGWGPFRFKPLRLLKAVFDAGAPTTIEVVGAMFFDPANRKSGSSENRPYGPDDVYRRDDLLKLTLTKTAIGWTHAWSGIDVTLKSDGFVDFKPTAPEVSFEATLDAVTGGYKFEPVDARLTVDVAKRDTLTLDARLFGSTYRLTLPMDPSPDGLTATLAAAAGGADGPTSVTFLPDLAVTVSAMRSEIRIGGSIEVRPRAGGKLQTSLVSIGPGTLVWLDLSFQAAPDLTIDHQTGLISARAGAGHPAVPGGPSPLFGLVASGGVDIEAALACVCLPLDDPQKSGTQKQTKLAEIVMSSAYVKVGAIDNGPAGHRIEHVLLASEEAPREHAVEISWSLAHESPIRWPVRQLSVADPTSFDPAKADSGTRSHVVSIAGDEGARLVHRVAPHLRRHRIDADGLVRIAGTPGRVSVRRAVGLLVITDHELAKGADKRARWTTLDHVTLTTPSLMKALGKEYAFAARTVNDAYREEKATNGHFGIIELDLAASGFHDRALAKILWTNDVTSILIGGSAVSFPTTEGESAHVAVMPWIVQPANGPMKQLNVSAGQWRVSAADLWAGSPVATAGRLSTVILDHGADRPEISRRLAEDDETAADPAGIIPVEQAYFEKWQAGKVVTITPADLGSAPFFLRAMLAIEARWRANPAKGSLFDWRAESLLGTRFGNGTAEPKRAAARVIVRPTETNSRSTEPSADGAVDAALVAVSMHRAERRMSFRRVEPERATMVSRRELMDGAVDIDHAALIAILEVPQPLKAPVVRLVPVIGDTMSIEALPSQPLTESVTDLSPSAALGWPSEVAAGGLQKLFPELGDEMPVLGQASGFAGRFQTFGWPAFAAGVSGDEPAEEAAGAEALYLSFATHIVYDRSTGANGQGAPMVFDGPPARHLMPSVARRRSPARLATSDTLKLLLVDPAKDAQKPDGPFKDAAPILPPVVERATIGRRPGVFDTSVASLTLPAEATLFDPDHLRYGRPASSGPVAAHQLRNPRSPVLPADEIPGKEIEAATVTFAARRRTYVSLADLDVPTGRLPLFDRYVGAVDVVRLASADLGRHDKLTFELVGDKLLGPDWQGQLKVAMKIKTIAIQPVQNIVTLSMKGRLEIGAASIALKLSRSDGAVGDEIDLPATPQDILATTDNLVEVRTALARSSADTVIRLVLEFIDKDLRGSGVSQLPVGPRGKVVLPLMLNPGQRRVVPVRSDTIVFGDPAYDRQLASETGGDNGLLADATTRFAVAVDRREYDLGSTLYLAGGILLAKSGLFDKENPATFAVTFRRIPAVLPNGNQPPPEDLCFVPAGQSVGELAVQGATVVELPLRQLASRVVDDDGKRAPPNPSCPLVPGDLLQIAVVPKSPAGDALSFTVAIVAEPVIAPPPAVYSMVETTADKTSARVVIHAAAPLPDKIEFPQLLDDLALGHVRRRALFVWDRTEAKAQPSLATLDLLKYDRSGGTQSP